MKTESGKEKRMVQELDLLKKHQKISVKELAAALGVSEMTVRRDLELLRKNHVLERSYGYATLVEGGNGYSYEGENYDLRRARLENFAEKDRIAKYAASLIRPDDWVFLDNGTTVSRMTFYLPTDFEYTVLCYNFLILAELLKHSNIKVIFPGGYYHPEDYNFTSPEAVEFIRRHRANKAFLSVSGVHQSLGITCINANIVENKKAMIESSAQNIILADSSKFGLVKANHFADIPDMDLVITDTMLNRVTLNWKKGRRTHVFIDEFHVMFENEFSAAFFNSAWRQFRKRNAYPTAITQNVEYLLDSVQASTMLSNSEFIVMLNQAAGDREKLAHLLNISEEQMSYITNADAGCGLIKYGSALVPFVNRFPHNTELYRLMTTKPGEGRFSGGRA